MALGWQIIFRAADSRVLTPDVEARCAWSRSVAEVGLGFGLLAHGAADEHGHLCARVERDEAGRLARQVGRSLRARLGPGTEWEPARLRPIHDQRHLRNTFFYCLGQRRHHGLEDDPTFDATALPDLLGLRTTGSWMAEGMRRWLPRVGRDELLAVLGCDPDAIDARQLGLLLEAAAAAVGRPALAGRSRPVLDARAAALRLGSAGWAGGEVARALQVPPRTARRLRDREVPPEVLRAVQGQWALRSHLAGGPGRQ